MICLSRPYHFKYFKGCLPQIFTWSILEYFVPFFTIATKLYFHADFILCNFMEIHQFSKRNSHKEKFCAAAAKRAFSYFNYHYSESSFAFLNENFKEIFIFDQNLSFFNCASFSRHGQFVRIHYFLKLL